MGEILACRRNDAFIKIGIIPVAFFWFIFRVSRRGKSMTVGSLLLLTSGLTDEINTLDEENELTM